MKIGQKHSIAFIDMVDHQAVRTQAIGPKKFSAMYFTETAGLEAKALAIIYKSLRNHFILILLIYPSSMVLLPMCL
jgi:hypothetical protein